MFQDELYKQPFHVVLEKCSAIKLAVTPQQVEAVETATRDQANSRLWPKFRAGRVTASRWHKVCHTDPSQPAPSIIKDICYPGRHLTTPAIRWGIRHESTAKTVYCKTMTGHTNFSMRNSGFVIHSQNPEIGASPDGIVQCDCCGKGCLEVKCPYLVRDQVLSEVKEGATCLAKNADAALYLKKGHAYYYQVQCQLFVCGYNYGDFVVWTHKSFHCERIHKDDTFMEETLPMAKHFFQLGVLPELLGKCHTRPPLIGCVVNADTDNSGEATEPVWCYCRKEEYGEMVACDSGTCQYEWFHYMCVGVLSEPKGKWFCPECQKDKRKQRMEKR